MFHLSTGGERKKVLVTAAGRSSGKGIVHSGRRPQPPSEDEKRNWVVPLVSFPFSWYGFYHVILYSKLATMLLPLANRVSKKVAWTFFYVFLVSWLVCQISTGVHFFYIGKRVEQVGEEGKDTQKPRKIPSTYEWGEKGGGGGKKTGFPSSERKWREKIFLSEKFLNKWAREGGNGRGGLHWKEVRTKHILMFSFSLPFAWGICISTWVGTPRAKGKGKRLFTPCKSWVFAH